MLSIILTNGKQGNYDSHFRDIFVVASMRSCGLIAPLGISRRWKHAAMVATINTVFTTKVNPSVNAINRARKHHHHHVIVNYRSFVHRPTSCLNWVASMLLMLLLLFSTSVNIYYKVRYNNVVKVEFPDIYAAKQEWLFGKDQTGAIDISLVQDFIYSDNINAVTRLKSAILTAKGGGVNATTPCVAAVQHDAGSLYGFCDRSNARQVPDWADNFDALIIQTIYIATIEKHLQGGKATPFQGVVQGFRNKRTGWYKQATIDKRQFYCTTQQLVEPSKEDFTPRVLFTKAHGVLRNVNCASPSEHNTPACAAIKDREPFVLFDDGTGIVQEYEVLRSERGEDVILSSVTTNGRIGDRTKFLSSWPFDGCLYVRDGEIGWLGAGRSAYSAQIPTLALAAKVQLLCMLLVIWLIKFKCALYRIHHALYELSRLGIFVFLVIQLLASSYFEQDIMRTIYSRKRSSATDWLLFVYIESTIALASALVALSLLRIVFDSSMCQVGVSMTMLLPVVIGLVEILIAQILYPAYTVENGLMARP